MFASMGRALKELIYLVFLATLVLIGPLGLLFDRAAENDLLVKLALIVATATFPLAVRYIYREHLLVQDSSGS